MFDEKKKFDEEIVETPENVQSEQEPQEQLDVEAPSDVPSDTPTDAPSEQVDEEQDTFPRSYVEKLRDENAKYRQRAQQVDEYAKRLHKALVTATGRLQDASDLPFDQSHLDDPEELQTAIQELLANKPHLGSRKPSGNIGQGVSRTTDTIDLAGLLRSRA